MHVADPLMIQCRMGSMSSTSREWHSISGVGSRTLRLGVAFLVDVHRTSVNRCELRFAAACMASRKAWYRDAQKETLQTTRNESEATLLRILCCMSITTRRGLTSSTM